MSRGVEEFGAMCPSATALSSQGYALSPVVGIHPGLANITLGTRRALVFARVAPETKGTRRRRATTGRCRTAAAAQPAYAFGDALTAGVSAGEIGLAFVLGVTLVAN